MHFGYAVNFKNKPSFKSLVILGFFLFFEPAIAADSVELIRDAEDSSGSLAYRTEVFGLDEKIKIDNHVTVIPFSKLKKIEHEFKMPTYNLKLETQTNFSYGIGAEYLGYTFEVGSDLFAKSSLGTVDSKFLDFGLKYKVVNIEPYFSYSEVKGFKYRYTDEKLQVLADKGKTKYIESQSFEIGVKYFLKDKKNFAASQQKQKTYFENLQPSFAFGLSYRRFKLNGGEEFRPQLNLTALENNDYSNKFASLESNGFDGVFETGIRYFFNKKNYIDLDGGLGLGFQRAKLKNIFTAPKTKNSLNISYQASVGYTYEVSKRAFVKLIYELNQTSYYLNFKKEVVEYDEQEGEIKANTSETTYIESDNFVTSKSILNLYLGITF